MRLLIAYALLPFCAGNHQPDCDAPEADHVSALQTRTSEAQTTKKLQMFQRATSEGGSSTLEAVLASKKPKCTKKKAKEMAECFQFGSFSLNGLLKGTDSLDNISRATNEFFSGDLLNSSQLGDECDQFVKDQKCLWNNPCYNTKKVRYLPLDIEVLSDKKMRPKALCKAAKEKVLFTTQEGSETVNKTVGDMCSMTTQNLCEFFMTSTQGGSGVSKVFSQCETDRSSKISCKPWHQQHEAANCTVDFSTGYNVTDGKQQFGCAVDHSPPTTKKGCYQALKFYNAKAKQDKTKTFGWKKINYGYRPKGCYFWNRSGNKKDKFVWNRYSNAALKGVGTDKLKTKDRHPVCVKCLAKQIEGAEKPQTDDAAQDYPFHGFPRSYGFSPSYGYSPKIRL